MRVTHNTITEIKYIADLYHNLEYGQSLLRSLLNDVDEINRNIRNSQETHKLIYIDYYNEHTDWSPERTDPCPDYYGYFTIRFEANPAETAGGELTLEELNLVLCALCNFTEFNV